MGKKDRKVKKDVFSPLCDKHPKFTLDLFCVDCDKVICIICQATEHKSGDHTKILLIKEASTDCAETKEFLEYENKLNTLFTRENETLADNEKVNKITDQLKEDAEYLIVKHKQDLIDLIEKHHKILYDRIQVKYEQSKERLQSVNEQLCKNKNKFAGICQEINLKKESRQNVALFIAMKKSQDTLQQIEIELEEIEKINFVERYEFQAGYMVIQLLEEEKEFGDLLVTATTSPKDAVTPNFVVPPSEFQPRDVFVLPGQDISRGQEKVADENEFDDYEYLEPDADDEQVDMRMHQNVPASNDRIMNRKSTPPIAKKPSPGTIRRHRSKLHLCTDTVQLRGKEATQEPEKYIALYDYKPRRHDEIEIKAGHVVTVLEKCCHWFLGKASGRYGYFPGNYVQKAEYKDPAAPAIGKKLSPDTIRRQRSILHLKTDTATSHYVHRRDIEQTQIPVTAQPSMVDQKKLNMMWKSTDENRCKIYEECERISQFIENMSSSIVHVWPAYDTKANDDIVFVVLTIKDTEADLKVKDKLEKTGYNVFVTHVDSCNKESEHVLQKVDQLETNQCFSKLENLGSVINKHSDRLLRNHQYLSAISGSNVRSERFSLGQSEHIVSFQSCIVLYVIAKGKIPLHENKFEDNLDGIPVDVREGIFQRTILPSERYSKPVKMGCQITSNRTPESFGTLGGFFYHKDFGLCGVTCAHVVLEEAMLHDLRGEKKVWSKEESPIVFHPNTTQHEYKLGPVKEAVYRTGSEVSSGIDIAVFKIEGEAPDSGMFPEEPEMSFETGRTLGTSDLKYNTPVLKYGRTTALTRGYLEFENTTVRMIKYERKYTLSSNEYTFLLKNQIAVRPESGSRSQSFNDFGDSGAFVFVKDSDNQLVCIGICVGKLDTHGIVIPISAVKDDLGISNFYEFRWNRFSERWNRLSEKIKKMDEKLDKILERLPSS